MGEKRGPLSALLGGKGEKTQKTARLPLPPEEDAVRPLAPGECACPFCGAVVAPEAETCPLCAQPQPWLLWERKAEEN